MEPRAGLALDDIDERGVSGDQIREAVGLFVAAARFASTEMRMAREVRPENPAPTPAPCRPPRIRQGRSRGRGGPVGRFGLGKARDQRLEVVSRLFDPASAAVNGSEAVNGSTVGSGLSGSCAAGAGSAAGMTGAEPNSAAG